MKLGPLLLFAMLLAWPASAAAGRGPAAPDSAAARWLDEALRLRMERRYESMDSVAARVVERLANRAAIDTNQLARAFELRALARYSQGLLSDSLAPRFYETSARLFGRMHHPDTTEWVRGLDHWALLLTARNESARADSVLASARTLCAPALGGADTLRAMLWSSTARARRLLGNYPAALAACDSARALRVQLHGADHPRVADVMAEMGTVHARAGRIDEALSLLEPAVDRLEAAGPPFASRLAVALSELANVQRLAGDLARSIETIERQIAAHRSTTGAAPSVFTITPQFSLGLRLYDLADFAGASAIFSELLPRAEASFGAGHSRTEHIRAMAGVAAMMSGDTVTAAAQLESAHTYLLAHAMDPQHMSQQIEVYRSKLFARRGDLATAARVLEEGLERERKTSTPIALVELLLLEQQAEVRIAAADSSGLDSTLAALARRFSDPERTETLLHDQWLRIRARSARWRGTPDAPAAALDCEASQRERLLANLRAFPDQRALQFSAEQGDGLALVLEQSRAGGGIDVATAWDRLVRWRGLVTAELAARRAPRAAAGDAMLSAAHAEWVSAVRRLARAEVEGARSGAEATKRRAEAEAAERRYAALAEAHGIVRDGAAPSLDRVRSRLAAGEALVSIASFTTRDAGPRAIAFVTVGPEGKLHRIDLGSTDALHSTVARWLAALSTPPDEGHERRDERACRRLGLAVRAATWDRWAPMLGGAGSVVLVADGDFAELPWSALPDGATRYLVEAGTRVRTPSAERELLAPRERQGRGLLAVGDPDYGRSPEHAAALAGGTGAVRGAAPPPARHLSAGCDEPPPLALEALPGARQELDDVVREWSGKRAGEDATRLFGAEATETEFLRLAPRRSVLHLATHGIAWGDSCAPVYARTRGVGGVGKLAASPGPRAKRPVLAVASPVARPVAAWSPWSGRRVWLALAGANRARAGARDANDGLLTAEEVVTLDLADASWVVLSACQSGVGRYWPLEGSTGMRRAFQLAGARTVIASQWSISDEDAREWMRALYASAAGPGGPASEAMASAHRALIEGRRRSGRDTHPFFWAAFTATGD